MVLDVPTAFIKFLAMVWERFRVRYNLLSVELNLGMFEYRLIELEIQSEVGVVTLFVIKQSRRWLG